MTTFLLVHGTFAKSADWPALQEGLTEVAHEAGERAYFKQLPWSGKNRAAARQAAASAILESVQDIQSDSSNEKIFLIGHSHGGSAIAYFLKEYTEAAKTLSGCAFLSTPFVAIRPRKHVLPLAAAVFGIPLLVAGCFLLVNYGYFAWAIGFVVSICLLIPVSKVYRSRQLLEQTIRQQTADIPPGNYFFIRCSGDEAAAALSTFQFVSWLNMRVSKILVLLTHGGGLIAFPIMVVLGFTLLRMRELFGLVVSCLFVLCLLPFFIFLLQAVTSRVFGWTGLATGFLVELAIEPVPFGNRSLVHVKWSAGSTGPEELLPSWTHSWTYADPAAIEHLRNWVKASLQLPPPQRPLIH